MRGRVVPLVFASGIASAIAAIGCGDPSVDAPDARAKLDAGGRGDPPARPALDPPPARQPWSILTLHGRAPGARRVIIEGAGNPVASAVLPDSTFCVDLELDRGGGYELQVFAQGADGQLSEPAGPASVIFDPNAPGIPGLSTCSGADPAGCTNTTEICDNGRDDNCNNLVDAHDPDCASCTDDLFEPNDDANAPRVDPGRVEGLKICPGNPDNFGVLLKNGETLTARIFFVHTSGNLDLELLGLDQRTVLARAAGFDDDETLTHTATVAGRVRLVVFGAEDVGNDYALDVEIE